MAEQGFTVRLTARVDGYLSAMEQAKKATKDLGDGGANLDRLGGKMQDVGSTLSTHVTLPLVAVGGVAVKMSSDFEGAFARMQGLAGVTADEVDGLKASVLKLAGETGQAPQDLADGLYFLRSSGLSAGDAMDALQVSARASAAGLGSTAVIADAVSSAMNAYAKSGLSAAEATDILTGTARAGKAEPAELAGALGRVLPIASELGVTFKDVGGAIAALSLTGNDASTSATLLTNILSKLLKPSQQGAEALAGVGMSADSIRASIADKGLLATLEDLKTRLGDAGFVKFLEDAQAVQGALSLTGQNAEGVRATFDNVAASVGATDEAFGAVAQTSGFKMKQAWADVQVALIQAGDVIMPIVSGVAGAFGHLAQIFSDLPGPVQMIVVGLLGLVAAAGPLLMIGGSLIRNFKEIKSTMSALSSGTSSAGVALGALGLVMIAATAWYSDNAAKKARLVEITNDFAAALKEEAGGQQGAVDAAIAKGLTDQKLIDNAKKLGLSVSDMAKIVRGESVPAFDALQKASEKYGLTAGTASQVSAALGLDTQLTGQQTMDLGAAFSYVSGQLAPLNDGLANAKEQMKLAAEIEGDLADNTSETDRETRKLSTSLTDTGSSAAETAEQTDALKAAQEEATRKSDLFAESLQSQIDKLAQLYPKEVDAVQAKYDYRDATEETMLKVANLDKVLGDHKSTQEDVRSATLTARDAILDQAEKFSTLDGAAAGSEGAIRRQIQSLKDQEAALAPDSPLRAFLDEYIADLSKIPSNIDTFMNLHISSSAVNVNAPGYLPRYGGQGASGVQTRAGSYYEVNEGGRPEMYVQGGRQYLLPGGNGEVVPFTPAPQNGWGGGSGSSQSSVDQRSVNFYGGINSSVDMKAAWQQANFYLTSAA